MLDFSVGDLAGTLGLDSKIAGVDLNKLNLADILGLKKKKKKRLEDEEDEKGLEAELPILVVGDEVYQSSDAVDWVRNR